MTRTTARAWDSDLQGPTGHSAATAAWRAGPGWGRAVATSGGGVLLRQSLLEAQASAGEAGACGRTVWCSHKALMTQGTDGCPEAREGVLSSDASNLPWESRGRE